MYTQVYTYLNHHIIHYILVQINTLCLIQFRAEPAEGLKIWGAISYISFYGTGFATISEKMGGGHFVSNWSFTRTSPGNQVWSPFLSDFDSFWSSFKGLSGSS